MHAVPMKDAMAVAVNTAPASMPAALRIVGLTMRIYAIVINVVRPARISVLSVVLFSFSLNNFSSMLKNSPFYRGVKLTCLS